MFVQETQEIKLEGYHNTKVSNVENILQNGFISRYNDEHWLGQGIYFFADIDTAIDNINMLEDDEDMKTICAEIVVDKEAYLDLDLKENLNKFRKFCQEKSIWLNENGKQLKIKESDKKKVMLKYKCFFLDLFKNENKYAVLSKTFSKEKTPYAEALDGISYLGLGFLEKYICVGDNKYIVKKNLVEKELIV